MGGTFVIVVLMRIIQQTKKNKMENLLLNVMISNIFFVSL